jgi:hypothetical protein
MQGDWLIMSAKERKRKVILEDVLRGRMRLKEAASHLGVGCRRQNVSSQSTKLWGAQDWCTAIGFLV